VTVDREQGRIADDSVRVVIGEPRPLMRVAFSRCLTEHGFSVLGEGVDAAGTIKVALAKQPAICLLAGDLPGGVVTALVAIGSATPETRIVVVAERESVGEALECICAGAAGYLSKDIAYHSLPRALRGAVRGEVVLSRTMTRQLLAEIRATEPNGPVAEASHRASALTVRELQVLELLSRGASTTDIAGILSISPITARRHCGELCRKLGARDRAAVVALVGGQLAGVGLGVGRRGASRIG
jgi:DNA-binding NarL/FixJ family response regulator